MHVYFIHLGNVLQAVFTLVVMTGAAAVSG